MALKHEGEDVANGVGGVVRRHAAQEGLLALVILPMAMSLVTTTALAIAMALATMSRALATMSTALATMSTALATMSTALATMPTALASISTAGQLGTRIAGHGSHRNRCPKCLECDLQTAGRRAERRCTMSQQQIMQTKMKLKVKHTPAA
jgi:hypothetical protein